MSSFLNYTNRHSPVVYQSLKGKTPGTQAFNQAWKNLASKHPQEFEKLQHDFIKQSHYTPVVKKVNADLGLNIDTRSTALQNVVWSMGVQHGSNGASNIFKAAGIKKGMSDREIIQRLYTERMKVDKYFARSSTQIKYSVKQRFQNEMKDALSMLASYENQRTTGGVRLS